MKNITLNDKHVALGAKMVPFAGFNMPVQYEGVNAEHETVRNGVGVFDVSHMGEFLLTGKGALDLIQKVTSNDASTLTIGRAQYSCLPNGKGGIVDDLIVYRMKEEQYLLVVNASNIEKDWNWISQHNTFDCEMRNLSDDYSLLAIQGPKAVEAMQSLTSIDLSAIKYYHFEVADFAGIEYAIISATGYTGSGGFEIYCKNSEVEQVWDKVMEAGASYGIKPIGLAARDTLRLEMGFCLYGNDIDDTTSPLEAGLGWITKLAKDADFVDKDFLTKQKEAGVSRKLIAFEMIERGIPRHDYEIQDLQGKVIGKVTSGTMSPSMKLGIGLGYVTTENSALDTEINIVIRDKGVRAKVVKLPFYKKTNMGFFDRLFGKRPEQFEQFPDDWENILYSKVLFYKKLTAADQERFKVRMLEFLNTTQIVGVKTNVEDEDRVLLAASAIIPIFAFPNWSYVNLHEILLYPEHFDDTFQIGSRDKAILGMVGYGYMEGKMVISKKSLHHGFDNATDKRNTAIHEFVHLLDKADGRVDGLPVHFMESTEALPWLNFIDEKILEIQEDESDINDYGATNRSEFLAVAAEYFFERPELLEKKHPKLYEFLEKFFRQPLADTKKIKNAPATRHFDPCPCGSEKKFRNCCG